MAEGNVVKGVKFVDLNNIGDPAEIAKKYEEQGADEIVLLDINATVEARETRLDVISRVRTAISVPFAVGGGIRTPDDFKAVINAGADKASVNSAAVRDRNLIGKLAAEFGSEKVIVAIDARRDGSGKPIVIIDGGRSDVVLNLVEWAKEVENSGAGEILLTSKDADGTKDGYDLEMTRLVADSVKLPVTASGGCGKLEDFLLAFKEGNAAAALAASVFHYGILTVSEVKEYLHKNGISVKL